MSGAIKTCSRPVLASNDSLPIANAVAAQSSRCSTILTLSSDPRDAAWVDSWPQGKAWIFVQERHESVSCGKAGERFVVNRDEGTRKGEARARGVARDVTALCSRAL
jgi:hypothetical protein